MVKETFSQESKDLILTCITAKGWELIDLISRSENKRLVITVLVDKLTKGITLEECALLCRELKNLLEEKNIIDLDYVLEVASPGLDRPLKRQNDFLRSLNQEAVFFLNDLINGKCQWQGIISKVDQDTVVIQVSGEVLEIPLVKINKAQLVI